MTARMMIIAAMTGTALLVVSTASAQQRVSRDCRQEIAQLCPRGSGDRQARLACLRDKAEQVSESCTAQLRGIAQNYRANRDASPAQTAPTHRLSYGPDERQGVDFYAPAAGAEAQPPLILFIHGGGWHFGSRESTSHGKPAHFTANGYAYASLGYRLLPDAPVEVQAADVAAGLAFMRTQAAQLGFDPDRIILMGHSAGAHLAALVATDPQYAGADMAAIKGVVLLDGAGYDVAANMARADLEAPAMFRAAFSDDPARQSALSPTTFAGAPDAPHWLILHVASRDGSREQSQMLGKMLSEAGADVAVEAVSGTTHGRMNQELGDNGDRSTALVDAFLARVRG